MKNSASPVTIDHIGIVQDADNNSVRVTITSSAACAGCQAEGSCNMSGHEEKNIEIQGSYNVKKGDTVTVIMKQSMGYAALLLGYIFPVIPVLLVLIIMLYNGFTELASGLAAVGVLIPYYMILYLLRDRINDKFTFTLKI